MNIYIYIYNNMYIYMSIYVQIDDLSEHGFGKNPSLGSRTEVELPGTVRPS